MISFFTRKRAPVVALLAIACTGLAAMQQQFVEFGRDLDLELGDRQFVEHARSVRHRQRRLCVLADVPQ